MPTKEFLELTSSDEQDVRVCVIERAVCIYNTATDATAWSVNISLADWDVIKDFIGKQLIR